MATAKTMGRNICDETYLALTDIKDRIVGLRDTIVRNYGNEKKVLGVYERHLNELAEQIDWKLQIMSHSCSYEWRGADEYAGNSVSVGPAEKRDEEFSPGYLGG